mgnify:CR=1 FL=1
MTKVKMSDESKNSSKLVLVSKDTKFRRGEKRGQERTGKRRNEAPRKCSQPRWLDKERNDEDEDKMLEIS